MFHLIFFLVGVYGSPFLGIPAEHTFVTANQCELAAPIEAHALMKDIEAKYGTGSYQITAHTCEPAA
jgi:hypothetical protein